ncbi:hypothetical protein HPULCUR_008837 [Helicostylum pulchrum]|uniref:Ubiquitin-like domain-containing protein n=1 Tax=Helicostylum pulchrum TaxID=562976 RepID=A0ABP9Y908_9FUNG
MTETTDVRPDTPRPETIEQIALQIKSLEQRTTSVTLPRNASVLELKHEIQVAFDVDSNRQRLIFQGRVLKDDKHLTDYANLDNGKVIHLVIRPVDAPHNPLNDDPNPGAHTRGFSRATPNSRSRPFPSISSRFPMMEGYAFITLDSNLADIGDNQSLLSSVLNGLSANNPNRPRPTATTTTDNQTTRANTTTTSSTSPGVLPRSPFSFSFGRNNSSEFASPLASTPLADRVASGLPFPPSVEVRLARTLGSMRNVRTMLEDSSNTEDSSSFSSAPNSTPEQLQEIRNRLRTSGNNQSAQIGMVLNELADLMTEAAPRMRQVAQSLRQEDQSVEEERNTNRRVLNMSRIVQGMSLINHFLGSVLASADIDSRRNNSSNNPQTPPTTTTTRPPVTLPSFLFPRGNTEAVRSPAPAVDTRNTNTDTTSTPKPKSTLSNNTSTSSSTNTSSTSTNSGSGSGSIENEKKRKTNSTENESSDLKKRSH